MMGLKSTSVGLFSTCCWASLSPGWPDTLSCSSVLLEWRTCGEIQLQLKEQVYHRDLMVRELMHDVETGIHVMSESKEGT